MKKDFKLNIDDKCGVSYHTVTMPFPIFYAPDMYIVIIESGSGKIIINDKEYPYGKDSFFAASFTDYFSVIPETETGFYKFEFPCSTLETDMEKVIAVDLFPDEINVSKEDVDTIHNMCRIILSEIKAPESYASSLFLNSIIEAVVVCILSNIKARKIDERIKNALVYMYENFRSNIVKEDVADAIGISKRSFGPCFYENIGIHFKEYLNNIRLNYCMKLVKCTNMTLTDICFEAGFNSSQYFSSIFKAQFGISPKGVKRDNIVTI